MSRRLVLAAFLALGISSAAIAGDKSPWDGAYAGFNAGYGFGDNTADLTGDSTGSGGNTILSIAFKGVVDFSPQHHAQSLEPDGAFGGVQLGYNLPIDKLFVAGVEADIQYSDIDGSALNVGGLPGNVFRVGTAQELEWFGTVRGRLGFLATPRLLLFGTAGLAYGQAYVSGTANAPNNVAGATCLTAACVTGGFNSKVSFGSAVGGGFEWAVAKNLTFKTEYLRIDLGDQSIRLKPELGDAFIDARFEQVYEIVRAGINVGF